MSEPPVPSGVTTSSFTETPFSLGIQKSVNHKISQMDANNRSANEVSEHLRLQNEQLETENKALRKKIGEQANQLKRLDNNPHLPPCPAPPKPKVPVSVASVL